jgi:hypothetical protein
MTAEAANTTCSVLRGTAVNAFGDTIDDSQILFEHVPAILTETGRTIQDPSSPTPRTIRDVVCKLPAWTGVLNTDRITDESSGDVFIILAVTQPPTLTGAPVDLSLQLKRVSSTGT